MSSPGYAGDMTAAEAYELLKTDSGALLVDVRTTPEWQFVGVPDLRPLGRTPIFLSWQEYPTMAINAGFAEALRQQGAREEQTVLLICRSGARSRSAAMALMADGFSKAFNVSDGFEGAIDELQHRGQKEGWKAAGLPWIQQ